MNLGEGLRKHSFRKWYERELLGSHAYMVLLLLCTIGLLAAFEVYSKGSSLNDKLIDVAAVMVFTVVGAWSLRRYLYLLMRAERVANQAVCKCCDTYGKLSLVREDREANQVTVRCKKCQHEWPIEWPISR